MMALSDYISRIKGAVSSDEGEGAIKTWSGSVSGKTSIKDLSFVVFDMEMSGLDPKKDFIVSIGALKMTGGVIHLGKEFKSLVRPAGSMTKKNIEIHGIVPSELEGARPLDEVLPGFLDFISESVLVGHFVHMDLDFLNRALKGIYKKGLKNPAVDTLDLHEWLFEYGSVFKRHYRGGSVKKDLFSIAQRYGITISSVHDALSDAYITAQLFQRFLYFLQADGVQTLNELYDIGRA